MAIEPIPDLDSARYVLTTDPRLSDKHVSPDNSVTASQIQSNAIGAAHVQSTILPVVKFMQSGTPADGKALIYDAASGGVRFATVSITLP